MHRLVIILAYLTAVAGLTGLVWWMTYLESLDTASAKGRSDLSLAADRLVLELQRARDTAVHLADDPRLLALLNGTGDAADVKRLLQTTGDRSGASDVVLMRAEGGAVVASASGRAMAVPDAPWFVRTTHGALGFGPSEDGRDFINAAPVFAQTGEVAGTLVVSRSLPTIERSWRGAPLAIYFTDMDGRVLVSNREELRGAAPEQELRPIDGHDIRIIEAGRYVPRHALHLELDLPVVDLKAEMLLDLQPIRDVALTRAVAAGALLLVLGAAMVILWERRRVLARANQTLEARVAERTEALTRANTRLQDEVRERREAEAALTRAQADLVQASKLSALGQMSAGISHELNQPLMAIGSFAQNAETFLARGNTDAATRNLGKIGDLARRMGRIIRNLRAFARAEPEPSVPTELHAVIDAALEITETRRVEIGVATKVESCADPVWAMGGEVRLAQVVTNLISNALDAMADVEDPVLVVTLRNDPPRIAVRDCGTGLSDPDSIFDPFYSTKEVGQGLGLGLSISYGIVSSFGGRIVGRNAEGGGAEFIVELQPADAMEAAAE